MQSMFISLVSGHERIARAQRLSGLSVGVRSSVGAEAVHAARVRVAASAGCDTSLLSPQGSVVRSLGSSRVQGCRRRDIYTSAFQSGRYLVQG